MNRILAVRGQVVPVSSTPLTLHARCSTARWSTASRRSCGRPGSSGSGSRPGDVEASEDALAAIAEADLIVLGPGSLYTSLLPSLLIPAIRDAVLQAHARPASTSATSPRRRARRPASTSPRTSRRSSPTRARSSSTSCWPTTTCCPAPIGPTGRRRPGPAAARRPPSACAGRRPSCPCRGSSSTTSSTRTTPTTTIRPAWPTAVIRALEREAGIRADASTGRTSSPDAPDVTPLRARPRDRPARRAGGHRPVAAVRPDRRGRRPRAGAERPRGVGRPARRTGCAASGDGPATAAFDWGTRGGALPGAPGCAAGSSPAARSASPAAGRTSSSSSSPTRRPSSPRGWPRFGLPVSWRLRRGRGVVTSKNGEAVGTFLRRIGATGALLEVEARQVSRALRGELNRVLNAEVGQPPARGQRRRPPARRDRDARRRRAAAGPADVVRLVADARRATPEASLAELAERLEIHRSAVQRALERLERLATDRRRARRRPAGAARSGMIPAMRDVIVAAQLEDAHDPGRCRRPGADDRGADARGRRDPRHLPAVRLPGRGPRRPRRDGPGRRRRRAERPSRAPGRLHRRDLGADARRARRPGSSSATPSAGATPARPTS